MCVGRCTDVRLKVPPSIRVLLYAGNRDCGVVPRRLGSDRTVAADRVGFRFAGEVGLDTAILDLGRDGRGSWGRAACFKQPSSTRYFARSRRRRTRLRNGFLSYQPPVSASAPNSTTAIADCDIPARSRYNACSNSSFPAPDAAPSEGPAHGAISTDRRPSPNRDRLDKPRRMVDHPSPHAMGAASMNRSNLTLGTGPAPETATHSVVRRAHRGSRSC